MTGLEQAIAAAGSRAELARQLGVDRQLISHWCKIGYVPKAASAAAIRDLFGVDVLPAPMSGAKRRSAPGALQAVKRAGSK